MSFLKQRTQLFFTSLLRDRCKNYSMVQTRRATRSSTSDDPPPPAKKVKLQHGENFPTATEPRYGSDDEEPASQRTPPPTLSKLKGKARAHHIDKSQFLTRIKTPWKIGAHVSSAGGVENTVLNASSIGANAFALFLKSQRKWTSPPLTEHSISEFKIRMQEFGYESRHVLPHGSYLINLANPDHDKRSKSYECFLDDLRRCEALGLELYNFHPGSTVGATSLENAITLIAECINRAHQQTKGVTILLENMAGTGNIIGGDFAHLAKIIELVSDKSRVGVCFDTCHAFAAGYDIRTKEAWDDTLEKISSMVGMKYLRAIHLNDSLCGLGSRKDRHQNIGLGEIGLEGFRHIVRDARTKGIPIVLETPSFEFPEKTWGVEINVLARLSQGDDEGMGAMADEIRLAVNSAKVHEQGKGKRAKQQ